jgi:hypothetical protein
MNHVDFQPLFDRIGVPIDVVYNPEYEKYSNYVPSILPLRYDAFIYLAHTTALHPLHISTPRDTKCLKLIHSACDRMCCNCF